MDSVFFFAFNGLSIIGAMNAAAIEAAMHEVVKKDGKVAYSMEYN